MNLREGRVYNLFLFPDSPGQRELVFPIWGRNDQNIAWLTITRQKPDYITGYSTQHIVGDPDNPNNAFPNQVWADLN